MTQQQQPPQKKLIKGTWKSWKKTIITFVLTTIAVVAIGVVIKSCQGGF